MVVEVPTRVGGGRHDDANVGGSGHELIDVRTCRSLNDDEWLHIIYSFSLLEFFGYFPCRQQYLNQSR